MRRPGRATVSAFMVALVLASVSAPPQRALAVGDISGTVLDWATSSDGISGVTVVALDATTGDQVGTAVTTAGDGTYTIADLPDGDYVVRASKSGFLTTFYGGDLYTFDDAVSGGGSVTVPAGCCYDIYLSTDAVSGTVYDWETSSSVISGVTVVALDAATGDQVGTTTTSASDGTFTISGLAVNVDYVLRASKSGFLTTFYGGDLYTFDEAVSNGGTLTLPTDGNAYDIYLPTDGVSGTVYDWETNTIPVEAVTVVALVAATGVQAGTTATSAGDGTFTVRGLSADLDYVLRFSRSGYRTAYYGGDLTFEAAVSNNTLTLPADGNAYDGSLPLLTAQTITFGALVDRMLADSPFTVSATASSGLTVTFSSLTPGTCSVSSATVTAVAAGTCTVRASQAGNGTYAAAADVDRSFAVTAPPDDDDDDGTAPVQLPKAVTPDAPPILIEDRPLMVPKGGVVTQPIELVSGSVKLHIGAGVLVSTPSGQTDVILYPPEPREDAGTGGFSIRTSAGDDVTFDPPIRVTIALPAAEARIRTAEVAPSLYTPVRIGSDGTVTCLTGEEGGSGITFEVARAGTYALRGPEQPAVAELPLIRPLARGFHSRWTGQSETAVACPGQLVDLTVLLANTGTMSWVHGSSAQVVLGTNGPPGSTRDFESGVLFAPLYGSGRLATTNESVVDPGEIGTFSFRLRAPAVPGPYRVYVRPVVEGIAWLEDEGIYLQLEVR